MKKYTLNFAKTGKEWKSFNDGMEWLDDDKIYHMTWEVEGLWNAIRAWFRIMSKKHGSWTFFGR